MNNPFEALDKRLSDIEKILLDLKTGENITPSLSHIPDFKYIPIQEIFKKKICSKPTFYAHVRAGTFTLHKFGRKSFVDMDDFLRAFHKVQLKNNNRE